MKKMRITVNEKVYEVLVEVLEDDEVHYPGATQIASRSSYEPVAPKRTAAPVEPQRRPVSHTSNSVMAPIVGTVTKILVEPGVQVKENQPLIVLDAMKMDTYINAPKAGTIDTIDCKVGDSVQVGQKLISIK